MTAEEERRAQGAWLQAERRRRRWDVPEMARRLAEAAGDDRRTLPAHEHLKDYIAKRWENGKFKITERYLMLYCRAFDIDPAELFIPPRAETASRPAQPLQPENNRRRRMAVKSAFSFTEVVEPLRCRYACRSARRASPSPRSVVGSFSELIITTSMEVCGTVSTVSVSARRKAMSWATSEGFLVPSSVRDTRTARCRCAQRSGYLCKDAHGL